MLIVLESRNFSMLDKGIKQLVKDFIECNPDGVTSEDPDLSKIKGNTPQLVALEEPYRLVDCMNSNATESKEFVYQVMDYFHQDHHHLAISLREFKMMNRRLRILTNHRVYLRATRFRVVSLNDGRRKSGILGKDNLWTIITTPPESLPEENLEPDEDIDNKVLVTIESMKSGREDYMVEPDKPFILKDGRTLTLVLPDNPDIQF